MHKPYSQMVVWLITFFNHFHLSMSQDNKYLCLGVFGMWPLRQPLLTFHIWIVNLPQIAELFRGQLKNVMTAIFAHFFCTRLKRRGVFLQTLAVAKERAPPFALHRQASTEPDFYEAKGELRSGRRSTTHRTSRVIEHRSCYPPTPRLIDRLQIRIIVVSGLCISIAWPQDR